MSQFKFALEYVKEEIREAENLNSMDSNLLSVLDCTEATSESISEARKAIKFNGSRFQPLADNFLREAQLYNNDLSTNQSVPVGNTPAGGQTFNSDIGNSNSMSKGEEPPKSPNKQVTNPTDIKTTAADLVDKIGNAKDAAYQCAKNTMENKEIASLFFNMYKKLEKFEGYADLISKRIRNS